MSQIQNTIKRPISSESKNIGVIFGGFSPLHSGHKQQIYKAAMEQDLIGNPNSLNQSRLPTCRSTTPESPRIQ